MDQESTPRAKKQGVFTPSRRGLPGLSTKSNKQEKRQPEDDTNINHTSDNDDADRDSPDEGYLPKPVSSLKFSGRRHVSSSSISRAKNRDMMNREHVENSSDSEADEISRQERFFESAFKRFDPNGEDQISISDFLAFFDALQIYLPPLSPPILTAEARDMALQFMSNSSGIAITREALKELYKQFTGKSLVQDHKNMNNQSTKSSPVKDPGTIRAKTLADNVQDGGLFANLEQLTSATTTTPKQTTRKKAIGDYFQRPMSVRRQTSSVASGSELSDNELGGTRSLSDVLNESSSELTGIPLASSTPNQFRHQNRDSAFTSPLLSPQGAHNFSLGSPRSRHESNQGESFWGISSQPMSPSLDIINETERKFQETFKQLQEQSRSRENLSAELSELRKVAIKQQKEHEKELLTSEKEIDRLNHDIDIKSKEIERLRSLKNQVDEEIGVYEAELDKAKEQLHKYELLHHEDRDNIQEMTSQTNKLVQQNADANRQVSALTADLKKVIADRDVALAEKEAVQKKANFVVEMGRQVKQLKEEMKDRDVEIERLKAECDRRQQEVKSMEHERLSTAGGGGRSGNAILAGEVGDFGDDDNDISEEDDEEEEISVTTHTTKTRKVKRSGKGTVNTIAAAVRSEDDLRTIQKVTLDRGIQTMPEPEIVLPQELKRAEMQSAHVQTNVAIDAMTSLEDHFQAWQRKDAAEFKSEALDKIDAAEAMARDKALTVQQIEALSEAIGAQDEVIKRLIGLGGTNVRTLFSRKAVAVDERDTLGYACVWAWEWFQLQLLLAKQNPLFWLYDVEDNDINTAKDAIAKFYLTHPPPSASYFLTMVLLCILFFSLLFVTSRYIMAVNHHEAMWRQVNSVSNSPINGFSLNPFGGRTFSSIKYELERRYGGNRRMPV